MLVQPHNHNAKHATNDRSATPYDFAMARRVFEPVLALGAESKGSICFYRESRAELIGGLGNLTQPTHYRRYRQQVEAALHRAGAEPALIAHDAHPSYVSTRLARSFGWPCLAVQHHHAHAMTIMAEHDVCGPVLALVCDGAGFGSDGTIWGCELLVCREETFQRVGHHATFPLLGGDLAAVQTWRPALALLRAAFGNDWKNHVTGGVASIKTNEAEWLAGRRTAAEAHLQTSSLGRLFDGVSCLLGLCDRNEYEGQAVVALQRAAEVWTGAPYAYETLVDVRGVRMSLIPCVRALVADAQQRRSVAEIAGRFHETVARMLTSAAQIMVDRTGIRLIVLSGGCFVNELLRERVIAQLAGLGLDVLTPRRTSFGDDSLALGQAVIGAAWLASQRRVDGPTPARIPL